MTLLRELGFLINLTISDLAPSHSLCFLGLIWDTSIPLVSLVDEKLSKVSVSAQNLLCKSATHCQELQQFLGCTNFAAFAVP